MDIGLRAPIIPDKHTRGPRSLSLQDPRKWWISPWRRVIKRRTSTANFYFDRRYKYTAASSEMVNHNSSLAFAFVLAFATFTYLFQYFLSCLFPVSCELAMPSENVSLFHASLISASWHAPFRPFREILAILFSFDFLYLPVMLNI